MMAELRTPRRKELRAIEPIQMESALSLTGMTKKQAVLYVILPAGGMSASVPAFVANVIFLLKETSVFLGNQSDGSDVYSKRPDRALL